MKKYSMGLFMILLAISLAAFTSDKTVKDNAESLYWFNVPGSINNGSTLTNSQVSYLNAFQASDPLPGSCAGGIKYCHVGFRASQVTVSGSNVSVNGTQSPISFNSKP